MKRLFSLAWLLTLATPLVMAQQTDWSKIDQLLEYKLRESGNQPVKVTIFLADQVDLTSMVAQFDERGISIHDRRVAVVTALQQKATETQGPLLNLLRSHPGVRLGTIKPRWISNEIQAEMTADVVAALSLREEVGMLLFEPPRRIDDAEASHNAAYLPAPETAGGREPGLNVIKAPAMWSRGYTGVGKKILIIDSGVSLSHPAHQRNYYGNVAGNTLAWYNPGGQKTPFDCDNHGTHVAGVAVGMQLSNRDTFGVAFNAMWMGSPAIDGGTGAGACAFDVDDQDALQWALDPDGNPATTDDMPDVINGSYGQEPQFFTLASCSGSSFIQRLNALEAASITFVQSAGNAGPGDSTMGADKNFFATLVNSFTVGAVNGNNPALPIASFSSRGPSRCPGPDSLRYKPEVSAPGSSVRSSVPGGGFMFLDGTSFSAPHVAGAALLLHEAFPTATSVQVKQALYFTAVDKGVPGDDNAYGKGVIDLDAAFTYLVNQGFTPAPVSRTKDAVLAELTVENVNCGEEITPEIVLENNGSTNMTSAQIELTYSNGATASFAWTGNLAPHGTEIVQLPTQSLPVGYYSVSVNITQVDGQADYYNLDNVATTSFSLLGNDKPTVSNTVVNPAAVCANGQALLTATTALPNRIPVWYNDANGVTQLGVGNSFLTPPLTSSKLYYVGTIGQETVGMANSAVGASFPSFNIESYLEFEVYTPVKIKSVMINANSTDSRIIQIRNTNGQVIASKPTGVLKVGDNVVVVNFSLQPGTYRMGLGAGNTGLLATISNIAFPYILPGVMSITKSDNGFYSFFYNWVVEYKGACDLVQAAVAVAPGSAVADFTANKTVVDLGVSGEVTFLNNSTGASTYLWNFGDGNTSTAANPVHSFTAPGTYLVTLEAKATGGCTDGDTLSIVVDGTLGLNDLDKESGNMRVFPNPGTGLYTLEMNLSRPFQVEVQVMDLLGRELLLQPAEVGQQVQRKLDLSSLPEGVYLLNVSLDGVVFTEKLIKTR